MDSSYRFKCVYLELTNRCNCSCTYCPQSLMSRPMMDMEPGLAGRLLQEIRAQRLSKSVRLHVLGEPSLYPWIFDILELTERLDLAVTLVSNGMSLGSDFGRQLARQALHEFVISVQTPDAATYRQRQAPIAFNEYLQGIIAFLADAYRREIHGTYVLRFMSTSSRMGPHEILRRWCHALGPVLGIDASKEAPLAMAEDTRTCLAHQKVAVGPRVFIEFWPIIPWPGTVEWENDTEAKQGGCHYWQDHLAVLADGTVARCCWDFDGRTAMGNVCHDTLRSVLAAAKQRGTWGEHPFCRQCLSHWQRLRKVGIVDHTCVPTV